MGSLTYKLETGVRSEISFDDHDGLESLVENAWSGQHDSTTDMLKHAECLHPVQDTRRPVEHPVSEADLIARIAQWRKNREEQHGYLVIDKNARRPG